LNPAATKSQKMKELPATAIAVLETNHGLTLVGRFVQGCH